jgi:hypothetical protein
MPRPVRKSCSTRVVPRILRNNGWRSLAPSIASPSTAATTLLGDHSLAWGKLVTDGRFALELQSRLNALRPSPGPTDLLIWHLRIWLSHYAATWLATYGLQRW